jgi:hypothetical protein
MKHNLPKRLLLQKDFTFGPLPDDEDALRFVGLRKRECEQRWHESCNASLLSAVSFVAIRIATRIASYAVRRCYNGGPRGVLRYIPALPVLMRALTAYGFSGSVLLCIEMNLTIGFVGHHYSAG